MQSNGLPLRTDDHGDSSGAATGAGGHERWWRDELRRPAEWSSGPTDVDFFSFVARRRHDQLQRRPAARSPNLDALIELRNGAGALLASSNPADALDGAVTYNAAGGGTFYVAVKGPARAMR